MLISVKETQDVAWICLPDNPYPPNENAALPALSALTIPRQLPHRVRGFVGRTNQLAALTDLADDAAGIVAISGPAGAGKTALAVHWAHRAAHLFPDGQLYVNLRGFDPSGVPMSPSEAVRGFLDAFAVPAEQIPVSQQGAHATAIQHFTQALTISRALGDRNGEATVLARLGDAHHALGDAAGARSAWQQSLDILDVLGIPPRGTGAADPNSIRTKLNAISRTADRSRGRQPPPPTSTPSPP